MEKHVGFANCEVDRIVPPFKGDNPLEVGVEGFYEWIVERKNVKNGLQIKGMQLEDDLSPFFERKLYTLNCGHAILAYLGHVKAKPTTDIAIRDKEVQRIVHAAIQESGEALIRKHGFDVAEHQAYIRKTMSRYANPNIKDDLVRVGRNPLRKLSPKDRLMGPVGMCKEFGMPRQNLLKGVAAAFFFDAKDCDEEAVELQKMISQHGIDHAVQHATGLSKGDDEYKVILNEYQRLMSWRYPANAPVMSNL
jgi:mannitol-1-phosphate 5-dehydrogenase